MRFQRSKKDAILMFLNEEKQAQYDKERYAGFPDVTGSEIGNNYRCLTCGAPAGKQCIKADGTFRNYPHQKRRDVAFAYLNKASNDAK